jgi:hypothetical protein
MNMVSSFHFRRRHILQRRNLGALCCQYLIPDEDKCVSYCCDLVTSYGLPPSWNRIGFINTVLCTKRFAIFYLDCCGYAEYLTIEVVGSLIQCSYPATGRTTRNSGVCPLGRVRPTHTTLNRIEFRVDWRILQDAVTFCIWIVVKVMTYVSIHNVGYSIHTLKCPIWSNVVQVTSFTRKYRRHCLF